MLPTVTTSTTDTTGLDERVRALRAAGMEASGLVIAVMSGKGGVGKTLLSLELAYLLDAVLVDFDWDGGNSSRALGYYAERYKRAPLLDALDSGRTPRPRQASRRPDYVPAHPDLAVNQPAPEQLAEQVGRWAGDWKRPVIADTHPGGTDATLGVVAAADLVLMPTILGTRELAALERTLAELSGYPILLVPNQIPPSPPAKALRDLRAIAERYDVQVGPAVQTYGWLRTRRLRTVITASATWGARAVPLVRDFVDLGEEVLDRVT